jgi:hypothetical protein
MRCPTATLPGEALAVRVAQRDPTDLRFVQIGRVLLADNMHADELQNAFWRLKESRIRISPAHTTRASSIGEPCERKIFYSRTVGEQATPYSSRRQALFDLGKASERYVIRELEAMGVEIVQTERDYLDRERELSGRVDLRVTRPGWGHVVPLEIKGLNPHTVGTIKTIEDIRASRQHWVRRYYDQLQVYIHFDGADIGVFALLDKVSGEIIFIDCPRDDIKIKALLDKAERIRDAVASRKPPDRSASEECNQCPFSHVCLPDLVAGDGVHVMDNNEVERLIARREELSAAKSEFNAIDRRLNQILPQVDDLVVGAYWVKSHKVHRASYTAAETSYWRRVFTHIGEVNGT